MRFNIFICFLLVFFGLGTQAQVTLRKGIDLSPNQWDIRLDTNAGWKQDILIGPPFDILQVDFPAPSQGWDNFRKSESVKAKLPATVEQFFWDRHGNPYGVCGNYVGVSWFSTNFKVPEEFKGKRIVLWTESVRLRAQIYINQKPVGYDLVNGTPFEVEITDYIVPGAENTIDYRITDPNGNFNWKDSQTFWWGDYPIIPSHGFGGITGRVQIYATDKSYIRDVYIKNKAQINEVDIQVEAVNTKATPDNGKIILEITRHNKHEVIFKRGYDVKLGPKDSVTPTYTVRLDNAKLWSVSEPNLYDLNVRWESEAATDNFYRRFGFRWFEIKEVNGDCQFFLNHKRIVLRSAISWGFWPINGITPSDSLARRQIKIAKDLGLNMINFHRQISQPISLEMADELGLLCFEEPGGNKYPGNKYCPEDPDVQKQTTFYFSVRNERLSRMIVRDRSHPSLIIYNLHNERGEAPQAEDSLQMQMAHHLDETRIITYNSSNGENPVSKPDPRFKLHLFPYDTNFYSFGWWDEHHAGGPGVYHNNLYNNTDQYHRKASHKNEIIFWGEEGAIGTPPRLQLIRHEILNNGTMQGWQTHDYLTWYEVYKNFLDENKFNVAFPTVDDLTREIGNVSFYYQGRMIENIRLDNIVDGYVVNGWESIKLENHSGIVDNYRYPKGDPGILAYYNQPLYVAVKIRDKILPVNDTAIADLYIINESDIQGTCQLRVLVRDQEGDTGFEQTKEVHVSGGTNYGELLWDNVKIPVPEPGYTLIEAELIKNKKTVATGNDEIFAVELSGKMPVGTGMIADTSGLLENFVKNNTEAKLVDYNPYNPQGNWILVGEMAPPDQWGAGISALLEWVYEGNTLIIIKSTDKWAEFLANKEVIDYRGKQKLGISWFGGNYFVKKNPYFEHLPVDCAFNWEYQCFATYNKDRYGLRINSGETQVACISDHKKEVYSAFSIIHAGKGKIILSTLDIFSCLQDIQKGKKDIDTDGLNASINTYNSSASNKAGLVGQQLLLNLLVAK